MATWYVSPLGTDAADKGTGVGADAFLTLGYALAGSRVAYGDTIRVQAGDYTPAGNITCAHGVGTGSTITVMAHGDGAVTFAMTNAVASGFHLIPAVSKRYVFSGILVTNATGFNCAFFGAYTNFDVEFNDCSFTIGGTTGAALIRQAANAHTSSMTFRRCVVTTNNAGTTFVYHSGTATAFVGLFESCTFNGSAAGMVGVIAEFSNGQWTARNCTFYNAPLMFFYGFTGGYLKSYNNIIYRSAAETNTGHLVFAEVASIYYAANPTAIDIQGNVFSAPLDSSMGWLCNSFHMVMTIPRSNRFIQQADVGLTNAAAGDFTLTAASKVSGIGISGSGAAGVSMSGAAFAGPCDVGAYPNPSTVKFMPALIDKVAFVGDSIMAGGSATAPAYEAWSVFRGLTGMPTFDPDVDTVSIPGENVDGARFLADHVACSVKAKYAVLCVGINSLSSLRTQQTNAQVAASIIETMHTFAQYGITPAWGGVGSKSGNPPDNTVVLAVNALVQASCAANGWASGSYLDEMMALSPSAWKTTYYDALTSNVHPNNAGHAVIASVAKRLFDSVYRVAFGRPPFGRIPWGRRRFMGGFLG